MGIDLFCGLGGWTEGLLAEGYDVVGFDIERHVYGEAQYPAQLVLQDVLTLHGSQFKDAALIVASPPCQAYSYRAMPWKRAKALPPPDNALFEACFRIQREAEEAAGGPIPLVVENVCGAQKWVGRARWHYGSFYLWGDVPALMPIVANRRLKFNPDGTAHPPGSWFAIAGSKERDQKTPGFRFDGSGKSFQSESVKVAGLNWSNYGKEGYKAEAFNTTAEQRLKATSGHGQNPDGRKTHRHMNQRDGHSHTRHLTNQAEHEGVKFSQSVDAWFDGQPRDKMLGDLGPAAFGSKSSARKAASAHIAKIPLGLSRWIARAWKPTEA